MIELSPGEMLFIGQSMQAKYIDYQYANAIEACGDISTLKKHGRDSLEKRGLCEEDFSGDMTISDEVVTVMKPVFFGEKTISFVAAEVENPLKTKAYNYHFNEGKITKVVQKDEGFSFETVKNEDIIDVLNQLIKPLEDEINGQEVDISDEKDISRVISIKKLEIGKESSVNVYFETKDGHYCKENEDGQFISIISADIVKLYEEV